MRDEGDEDPDADIKQWYRDHGHELNCRVCGKLGVKYHPLSANDNLSKEIGGWCSLECFHAEAKC